MRRTTSRCVGGVGKQHHGERQLRQKAQSVAAYVDAQHAQPIRAEDKAKNREHDWAADQGPLDPAGDRAVDQEKGGQESGILVHLRYVSENAPMQSIASQRDRLI